MSNYTTVKYMTMGDRAEELFKEPIYIVLVLLSICALFANLLSFGATLNIPPLSSGITLYIPIRRTAHIKLIISLSLSDMCVACSVFLHIVVRVTQPHHEEEYCIEVLNEGFLNFALLASLLNLLAMGIDHYLAVKKSLSYHRIMSPVRANIMIASVWVISLLCTVLDIPMGILQGSHDSCDFCCRVYKNILNVQLVVMCLVLVETMLLIYLYCHIFLLVRSTTSQQFENDSHSQVHQESTSIHSKKTIITTLFIVGTFMVCLIPNSVFQIFVVIKLHHNRESMQKHFHLYLLIHNIFWLLMVSNSLADPIIYALRLPRVRHGYSRMFTKICKLFKKRRHAANVHLNFNAAARHLAEVEHGEAEIPLTGIDNPGNALQWHGSFLGHDQEGEKDLSEPSKLKVKSNDVLIHHS